MLNNTIKETTEVLVKTDLIDLKQRSLINKRRNYLSFKRTTDVIVSAIALVLLSPLFLALIILIKANDPKCKVLYKQKRIGKNGKYFTIYKFRTMVSDANDLKKYFSEDQMKEFNKNYKLENDPRITKIGKFLRRTSLDELPQLLNIIKGDLSIIGPRPVVEKEIEKYGIYKEKFLSVTPGLTGNWAANGRSCTSYEERIKLELDYIDNISLKMDIQVLFKTIITVFQRKGAI